VTVLRRDFHRWLSWYLKTNKMQLANSGM